MTVEILHPGHLKIIQTARELGEITVGLLTDEAISKYKRLPLLNYEQRKIIVSNIQGVTNVIPQHDIDYTENLKQLKPDFLVHGDDWKRGPAKVIRQSAIDTLAEWGGKLIEPESTPGLSASFLSEEVRKIGTTPDLRRSSLRRLIGSKGLVRIMEVHNGLTGLIVEQTKVKDGLHVKEFDGMWESSLTDSTSKGKPDTGSVDVSSRIATIEQILEVTTKPIIVDADNGGLPEHFTFTVRSLERLGVSAVIVEDKIGAKKNSLFGTDVKQTQDSIEDFSRKINIGKKSQITEDFMVIARVESLILNKGQEDALKRTRAYIEAGADGIMIHSKSKEPNEIIEFCKAFKLLPKTVPLIVVPSTYDTIHEDELEELGVNVVIYANHLLRSAFPAMVKTAETILNSGRAMEVRDACLPIKEIINLIPGGDVH